MYNLIRDIEELVRKYSLDNQSDTPDFIFAKFLLKIINAYLEAMRDMYNQSPVE